MLPFTLADGCRQVQEYIRHAFGQDWLVLPHEHPEPDVEGREAAEPLPMAGGFTMRRRHALADRS